MSASKVFGQSPISTCFLGLSLLAMLALGSGCDKTLPAATEAPVPKVTVAAVVQEQTTDFDEYIGQTEASETVEVRARVFGYLKSIEFKDGDSVDEGQTLFQIEPDEYKAIHDQSVARIALNAAQLELAKAKLARNTVLLEMKAVSREEYEETLAAAREAQAKITAAQADANRTALDLKYTEVKSPIKGRIDRTFVTKGNLLTGGLTSGTLLTKIINEQPMFVYFDVDERSLLRYMRMRRETRETAPGSLRDQNIACEIQLADETNFSHQGTLDFAASEVNKGTGTGRLRGTFVNADRDLASGLFVRVRIPVSEPYAALMIPEQALATDQNIKFVYVVGSDGKAARRPVELGNQRGEMRIIKSGLQAGERVIVKGLQRVRPGQKVDAELAPTAMPAAAPATQPDAIAPSPAPEQPRPTEER